MRAYFSRKLSHECSDARIDEFILKRWGMRLKETRILEKDYHLVARLVFFVGTLL